MEIRTLRYLMAVAQEGSISNAAASLHMTQPTLSRQLSALEDEMGCSLFTRTYKGMELNDNGARLLRYAETIIELTEKAENDLSSNEGSVKGSVYIGAGESVNMRYVSEAIQLTLKRFPEVDFQLFSGTSVDLMDGMARGTYDFLLECELKEHVDMNVLALPVLDRWGVMTLRGSRLSTLESVRPTDLVGETLLMARQAMKTGMLNKWAGKVANDLDIRIMYSLPLNAMLLARAGAGTLLTYEGLFETGSDTELTFVPLEPELTSRQGIIWRKGLLSKQATAFLDALQECLMKA
ncbi:LysR family transcriptional regulator [Adlercreutzia sp. ZJ154]|uniref:LysR family transcriptional regulator n=1 Tax=Adlercreutzia sp. ZJ154 TaxID=2709790 RepID=UPI0013EC404F|nr:LysR family transcriptional regulator [Adlercreutzia sp. ZJ154]